MKKCTVTQLDADFWRVGIEGGAPFTMCVFSIDGEWKCEIGDSFRVGVSADEAIDRMLWALGLTRYEPEPEGETDLRPASERMIRAFADGGALLWDSTHAARKDCAALLSLLDEARNPPAQPPSTDDKLARVLKWLREREYTARDLNRAYSTEVIKCVDHGQSINAADFSTLSVSFDAQARAYADAIAAVERIAKEGA